jgi:uncharacterized protein YjbJ (UPF0337 family)
MVAIDYQRKETRTETMSDSLHNQTKEAVDNVGGAGTANQAEGRVREVIGQGQQAIGEAIGSEKLQARGSTTELHGKAQQVGGLLQEHAQETGERLKEGFHENVEKAKAGIGEALDNVKAALDGDSKTNTVR